MWLCCSRSAFLLFFCFVFFPINPPWTDRWVTVDCEDTASGAIQLVRQSRTCLDTWGANSKVQLCLWNDFCITNCYLPSLVLQIVQAAKIALFLCIVSSVKVINSHPVSVHLKTILSLLFDMFLCNWRERRATCGPSWPAHWLLREVILHFPEGINFSPDCEVHAVFILHCRWRKMNSSYPPSRLENRQQDKFLFWNSVVRGKKRETFAVVLCPTLIVATGAQIRTFMLWSCTFLTFDYGARIEGIVTLVLLCETLYRVYHF